MIKAAETLDEHILNVFTAKYDIKSNILITFENFKCVRDLLKREI